MINKYRFGTYVMRFFVYTFLLFLLILTIIPIWLLIVNATRSTLEIQQGLSLIPSTHAIENYQILLGRGLDLPRGFSNSLFLAVSSTVVTVYFSLLTAYGLVVYKFKGRKLFSNFIIVLVMIPMQLSIVGFYRFMSKLGLTDNYVALILPLLANAGAVFFGKQYFESMLIQDLIFAFIASWNNFFNAFILISSLKKYTLPMLVQTMRGDVYRTEYGAIYLGLAITIVPIIIIYAIFSRYIVSGIALGAVKE
jgi:multiple sugar transport system permease protein